jgi:hypothetical protein
LYQQINTMYSKEEASAVRQRFWTTFGKYMQVVPSMSDEKVNWVNYKTGVKDIFFKLEADNTCATVAIIFNNANMDERDNAFSIFKNLHHQFINIAGADWVLEENVTNEFGKQFHSVKAVLPNIKVFRETDWPQIISFLKTNIIKLDEFWANFKPAFEK